MKKILFCVCVFCSINLNAQNYYITFGGTGAAASVSTVKVENLTAGTSLLINGTDILHLTSITTGVKQPAHEQVSKLKIYPNPMSDFSALLVSPAESGNATILVIDMSGKAVAGINSYLEKSDNEFRLSGLKKGLYFISVKGQNYLLSTKVLCTIDKIGSVRIEKISSIKSSVEKKSEIVSKELQLVVNMDYTEGERLKFTATSGKYSTVKTDIPTSDKTLTFNFIECTDGDGNNYPVVEIGTQVWMEENLKTTRYREGSTIGTNTFGYYGGKDYIWPTGGNENNVLKFGRQYSWYAAQDSACPVGWRLPGYSDWKRLTNGADSIVTQDYSGNGYTEFQMAKSLAASTDWLANGIAGSVGNKEKDNNSTGFTGLPAGSPVGNIGVSGNWWIWDQIIIAEIQADSKNFILHKIDATTPGLYAGNLNQVKSVRCIKGYLLPELTTAATSYVTQIKKATSGGYITRYGGSDITSRGVCWSTLPNPTIANTRTNEGPGNYSFISSITGLIGNTTYYVRAYATNSVGTSYGNEVIFKTYTGIVTDIDDNEYYTVTIGDQEWMAENLKTTKFNDNTLIPLVTGATQWAALITPGYSWYNNDGDYNKDRYGALYNWYTVSAANNGGRNVCPTGWHVPGDAEWTVLTSYLGGESVAGDKMKEDNTFHWNNPNSGTNTSGFTALPGGDRSEAGAFSDIGTDGTFWSSGSANTSNAWFRSMTYNQSNVNRDSYFKQDGFSVRCLKDN